MTSVHLPDYQPIRIRNAIDRYGFSHVLAKLSKRKRVPRSFANWVHGWAWMDDLNAVTVACDDLPRSTPIVVRNTLEKEGLQRDGFTDIFIGGLPFIYACPTESPRSKEYQHSLLAFVAHSSEAHGVGQSHFEYLDYLESLKNDFEHIYLSIYYLDRFNPIVAEAQKRGLKIIYGARPDDAHSLTRVRTLFDTFPYITTNSMGSHLLYALYRGCFVSICGPFFCYTAETFSTRPKDQIEYYTNVYSQNYVQQRFPHLFCNHPRNGYSNIDWAKTEIGEHYRLSPEQYEKILGWQPFDQITGYLKGGYRRMKRMM